MNVKTLGIMTILAIAGSLTFAGAAKAASIESLIVADGVTINTGDDKSGEYLVDDGDPLNPGFINIGSIVRGAINIDTLTSDVDHTLANGTNNQWSAVFSLEVKEVVNLTDVNGSVVDPDGSIASGEGLSGDETGFDGDEFGDIIFGPDATFGAYLAGLAGTAALPGGPSGPAVAAGTMVRFWQNPTKTFDRTGDQTTVPIQPDRVDENIATHATGSFFWDLGFTDTSATGASNDLDDDGVITSGNGEGWVARNGGLALTALAGVDPGQFIGLGEFSVRNLQGAFFGNIIERVIPTLPPGTSLAAVLGTAPGATGQFFGNSSVEGASGAVADAGFDASNSSAFTFVAVPTPAAAGPGLALIGALGLLRRRRQQAA